MRSQLHLSQQHQRQNGGAYAQAKETVMAELRQTFRPEFLNRIDDIIVFRALTFLKTATDTLTSSHAWARRSASRDAWRW